MKVLVWHWGRRGAGPLFAVRLAEALRAMPGLEICLSLAAGAEILQGAEAVACDWPEPTYDSRAGFIKRRLTGWADQPRMTRKVTAFAPDFAICAMPALLDGRMQAALKAASVPYAVIVHDAAAHPGEWLPFSIVGQLRLLKGAALLCPLSSHVEAALRTQGLSAPMTRLWHPPFEFGAAPPPMAHGGPPRLLCFGRLLPYKGLDLLADAVALMPDALAFELRVCGDGPDSPDLARLQSLACVQVRRAWVPEAELAGLIGWADAIVLPYREASQSGVAAAAIAAGRYVLATAVGGLPEQLAGVARARLCAPDGPAIAAGLTELIGSLVAGGDAVDVAPEGRQTASWPAFAEAIVDAMGGVQRGGWLPK